MITIWGYFSRNSTQRSSSRGWLHRAVASAGPDQATIETVVIVGNTVMHHLLCGLDVAPLTVTPFQSDQLGPQERRASELGWSLADDPLVRFLPCLGGFVGSDALAGVLATRMHESDELVALVDLGTNGEIVVGTAERMLCTSTAAGPAFETGGIHMGMQATTGAIHEVRPGDDALECRVLGGGDARGICGSGLVNALAAGLDLGWVEPSGRLAAGRKTLPLRDAVHLTQSDVRQLQLAKGAIAAGLKTLLTQLGRVPGDLTRVNLAGAFGNYVSRTSARRIGLVDQPEDEIEPVGNTALLGAKLALFAPERENDTLSHLASRIEHVSLAADRHFQDVFIEEMRFPG